MIIYSIIIILPFVLSILNLSIKKEEKFKLDFLWFSYLLFSLFIFGFRYQIGGDWNNYYAAFMNIANFDFSQKMSPGFNPNKININNYEDSIIFYLLNISIGRTFNSFIVFNLICSIIFIYSINKFCKILETSKYVMYGFFASYLSIVVHLGYVRQSLAIAFLALSFYFYFKNKITNSFFFIISTQTHIITSIFVPLFIKLKNIYLIILFLALGLILTIFAWEKIYLYYYYYLGDGIHFQSRGAFVRVLINIPFFLVFFFLKKQLKISKKENLFFKISLIVLIISIFLLFTDKSTIADRLALQLILFQGYTVGKIFSNLKIYFMKNIFIFFTLCFSYFQFIGWVFTTNFYTLGYLIKTLYFNEKSFFVIDTLGPGGSEEL